jgi:hypothetical protein
MNGREVRRRQRQQAVGQAAHRPGLLINKLDSDRFRLTTLGMGMESGQLQRGRSYRPDPEYGIRGPAAAPAHAAQAHRQHPAYYEAARANIVNPTREHTRLAIAQAPGVQTLLTEVDKAAQASILTPVEKQLFTQRVNAALTAVDGYVAFLTELDKQMDNAGRRSFRLGKELYEQKFAFDIQSASTAEQTYQKALAAREELLANMEQDSDELWDKTMGAHRAGRPLCQDRHGDRQAVRAPCGARGFRQRDPPPGAGAAGLGDQPQPADAGSEQAAGSARDASLCGRCGRRQHRCAGPVSSAGPHLLQRDAARRRHGGSGREQPARVQPLDTADPEYPRSDPGHYAQLVYANRSPSIVKSIFGNGAMVEGWAVYGERMMLESGYGNNEPEMWLMYSKWNLRSVTNTILDYSVHVLGMTEEQAIDLLTRQAFQTRSEAVEVAPRAGIVGAADQLLQRLQRDHGIARAAQAGARQQVQPEGIPRAIPQLRQRARTRHQGLMTSKLLAGAARLRPTAPPLIRYDGELAAGIASSASMRSGAVMNMPIHFNTLEYARKLVTPACRPIRPKRSSGAGRSPARHHRHARRPAVAQNRSAGAHRHPTQ